MTAIRIRYSITRFVGVAALVTAFALFSGAAAAPQEIGFYECGAGECPAGQFHQVSTPPSTLDPREPLAPNFAP